MRAPPVRRHRPAPDDGLAELRVLGMVPALPTTIYTAIVAGMVKLTEAGADYLRSRALDPAQAAGFGFRSVDNPADWRRLTAQLSESFLEAELRVAGFPKAMWRGQRVLRLPWSGRAPALLIPYRLGSEVVALRFRALRDGVQPKYRTLPGQKIVTSWNAAALADCAGAELHVAEGEIDALALVQRGYRAVALGGATPAEELLRALARRVGDVARLIVWLDADEAGMACGRRLRAALERAHGQAWWDARVSARRTVGAKDVAELLALGGAI